MTNDEKALFDELQREIEELRNLLATNAKGAASKVGFMFISCIISIKNKNYHVIAVKMLGRETLTLMMVMIIIVIKIILVSLCRDRRPVWTPLTGG